MLAETRAVASVLRVLWGAWHETELRLALPVGWEGVPLEMEDAAALSPYEVEQALDTPVDADRLDVLARGARTAAIAIDDITRPTPTATLLPSIVARLVSAGVPESGISVVIASGAHGRASDDDIQRKVGGALAARLRVVPHDCEADLADTGVELAGVPVRINKVFAEADVRVGVSAVMPHPFAAFSGGGKIVIPGVADLDVLARTHKFALMGLHGGDTLDKNRFRAAMEAAVRRIRLDWTVNVAVNSLRQVAALHAGDFVGAHRLAAADAARVGHTALPDGPLDALVVNAYPKDGELLQVDAAFVALRTGLLDRLRPGAPVVLSAACRGGLGTHRLLGPGGRLFRPAAVRNVLKGRDLILYSPGVTEAEARNVFVDRYPVTSSWSATVELLRRRIGGVARIGVLPCAPLQVPDGGVAHA